MEGVAVICLVSFNNKMNIDHITSQIYHNNLSKCIKNSSGFYLIYYVCYLLYKSNLSNMQTAF